MQIGFLIAVFVMLAIAGALVVPPLWRGNRRTAFAVAMLIPLAAVSLYALIGNPAALDPARRIAPATLEQAIDALAVQMRMKPDNLEGWVLLGRSRKEQERFGDAVEAYKQALRLAPKDPALMVELAETMALQDPAHLIKSDALKLLQQAQQIDPRNQRALWFLGIAAYQQNHFAEAAAAWQPLLELAPESTRPALHKQIDEARARAGMPPLPPEAAPAAVPALITVHVDISPALRAKLAPSDVLFVYARMPNGPPMPLAVKRVAAKDFPIDITLTDADGPMPTMLLSQQKTVIIATRVSHSGDATPQAGDFEAAPLMAVVGSKNALTLTIDHVHP